jgi:hypothetical protein
MRVYCALIIVAMAVVGLTGGLASASSPTLEEAVVVNKIHTRVFYLQGMDPREAATLLRSQAQVRQLAWIKGRDVIVVAGEANRVEQCETLLREHDAILRVADPHEPVALAGPASDPLVTRVFRVTDDNMQAVVVILRSIYQVRELEELAEDNTVSIQSTQPILDSSESLLRELELLDRPTEVSKGV